MSQRSYKITGMDCADEVAILKRELAPLLRTTDQLSFDLLNARMTVADPPASLTDAVVVSTVARTGMKAQPWEEASERMEPAGMMARYGRTALTAASGIALATGFVAHAAVAGSVVAALGSEGTGVETAVPMAARTVYSFAVLAGLWSVLPKAWFSLRRLRPDMNLLMTVAVIGAIAIGEWFEAGTVAFLFSVSLALEAWSVGRARRAVAALIDLTPQTAHLIDAGVDREVPASAVAIGSRVAVKPGERIPLDGVVRDGTSEVNQAPITGESAPVPKAAGVEVFAGTINGDGALEIETTRTAGDTTLAHIIRLVEDAQSRRAASEQWVERFARVYTPVVMGLAALVITVPPLAFAQPWSEWVYRGLVLLVIACPCALVISTPVSIVAALAAAARAGVLVKGGLYLELPARLRAVALDKTGTLTWGRPEVRSVRPLAGHDEREVLERAAALEARSEHPLARAILAYAKEHGVAVIPASDYQILQGKGATGRVDGREVWLGSHRYLEERAQETPEVHELLEAMSAAGTTAVVVGTNEHVCGLIAVADEVRGESRDVIRALRAVGVEAVVMLTGDNRGTAEAVARETGVDEVRAELLPADKVTAVEELLARYGAVAMIGDGVNDAPAMARATLSVAMGAAGSDAAIETADVALMADDLSKLPWLIRHSRRTLRVVRQNIVLSLAVKVVFVVLTFFGLASLWGAIAADMGTSLVVVANALRLLRGADGAETS